MASMVLGVIGAVVGSFFGCPQLGFMLGSMLGSLLDPQRISGPKLTDVQQQTSQDGGAIPIVWGRPQPFAGTLIWCADLVEHKSTKTQGKGGPKVTSYTYTRSYAIGFCKGPIGRITRAWRNNALVYTNMPGVSAAAQAASAKLAGRMAIYLGDEAQNPDPTMEATLGIGNVPGHRGMVYIVLTDDDVTDISGAVPQWKIEVETNTPDAPVEFHAQLYAGRSIPWADDATAKTLADPRLPGVEYEYNYYDNSDFPGPTWYDTPEEVFAQLESLYGAMIMQPKLVGWGIATYSMGGYLHGNKLAPFDSGLPDISTMRSVGLVYSTQPFEHATGAFLLGPVCTMGGAISTGEWARQWQDRYGTLGGSSGVRRFDPPGDYASGTGGHYDAACSESGKFYTVYNDVTVACRPKTSCSGPVEASWVAMPDYPGFYVDPSGEVFSTSDNCSAVSSLQSFSFLMLQSPYHPGDPFHVYWPVGPLIPAGDERNTEAFWTEAYAAAVADGAPLIGSDWVYGLDYPQAYSEACQCTLPAELSGGVPLSTIVGDLCEMSGLDAGDYDVSELVETVQGYLVGSFTGASDAILPLMAGFGFDAGEWDQKLRFVLRGADTARTLTLDDLVLQENAAPIKTTIQQDVELPKKLTVQYFDPATDGTPTTQSAERNTADVRAIGEQTIQIPVVMDANRAAQRAAVLLKTMWTEADGDEAFGVSCKHGDLTTTDCIAVPVDGKSTRVRIDTIESENGVFSLTCKRDRQSSSTSQAKGISPPATNPVVSGLIGPTAFAWMNLPALRGEDDRVGFYIAAAGYLSGWVGAEVQQSIDDGVTWRAIATITDQACIGASATELAEQAVGIIDRTSTLQITLPQDPLDSITETQLLDRFNNAVLGDEIIQFETATKIDANTYELAVLARGRFNTDVVDHPVGDRFVLLTDSVQFIPIDRAMIGRTLKFRAVSIGTAEDAAPIVTIDFTPSESETEWPPSFLRGMRDGSDNLTVTWVGRGRLSSGLTAYNSVSFAGFQVVFTDGTTTKTVTTTDPSYSYSAADQTTDFGSAGPLTVRVYALNAITGASPTYAEAVL